MDTRADLLKQLDGTVSRLLAACTDLKDPDLLVYADWTVKQTLGHIVFWHESFARNVRDLVNGVKPKPLKGKYADLNRLCFEDLINQTIAGIIKRMEAAHQIIREGIMSDKLTLIPYKYGSRDYSPEEHLDIVNQHISEHLKAIEAAAYNSKDRND